MNIKIGDVLNKGYDLIRQKQLKAKRLQEYRDLCEQKGINPNIKAFNEKYDAQIDLLLVEGFTKENVQRITENYYDAAVHNTELMEGTRNYFFTTVLSMIHTEFEEERQRISNIIDGKNKETKAPEKIKLKSLPTPLIRIKRRK